MLRIEKEIVALEPEEVIELERIVMDEDRELALRFIKKNIYKKLELSQQRCGCAGQDSSCC